MTLQIPGPLLMPLGLSALALVGGATAWGLWFAGRRRLAAATATLAALLLGGAAAPSLAQTAQELVAQAQVQAGQHAAQAQALLDATQTRQDRFFDQAKAIVEAAPARLRQGFADLEGSAFAGGEKLASLGDPQPADGVIYVAVSFSMPPADLRRLGREAHRAGAEIVIRGLVHSSFRETLLAAKQVFDEDSLGGVAIDPNVFRAFDIQAVPTFIAAAAPVQPCAKGLDCVPAAPPHDRVSGNISLEAALRLLSDRGEEGVTAATAARRRLAP